MKNILSILLILSFSLAGFSQKNDFKIKIKVDGMKESPAYLIRYFGKERYYKDTAQFNNDGLIVFEGEEHYPGGIYTLYTGTKILFEFVINREPLIELETDTLDYVNNMMVKKSKENEAFFGHLKFITSKQKESQPIRTKLNAEKTSDKQKKELNESLAKMGEEVANYRLELIKNNPDLFVSVFIKAMKETEAPEYAEIESDSIKRLMKYEYIKSHYFDGIDFTDPRINNTPLYHNKLEKFFKSVVYTVPDSIIKEIDILMVKAKTQEDFYKYTLHYLINHYEKSKIMGMDGVFAHLGLNYYTHDLAYWADSAQIEKVQDKARKIFPLMIGKQAINLTLLDTGSTWVNMTKDVEADYTVLVFWDPDCGHCKKELPKLAHYVDSVKSTINVKVYSVSSDHTPQWKKFITDNNLDFINVAVPQVVYKDQQKATELILSGKTDLKSLNYNTTYDIYTTPQIYLLDKSKKIIAKKLDTDLLNTVLTKEEQRKNR